MISSSQRRDSIIFYGLILHALIVASALVFIGLQIRHGSQIVFPQRSATPVNTPLKHSASSSAATAFDSAKLRPPGNSDYVYGSMSASISLITFMDFQCPYCAALYPVAKKLVDSSGGNINFVIRLFPLDFHSHADFLANAAECVGDQKGVEGFWAFSDSIFASGGRISDDMTALIKPITTRLKLDEKRFDDCVSAKTFSNVIQASIDEGKEIGVNGTPTSVLINLSTKRAKLIPGVQQLDKLESSVNDIK